MKYLDNTKGGRMIKILAPTTIESVDEGSTVICEMDQATFLALRAAVEIAYDSDCVEEDSAGSVSQETADDLWQFFHGRHR